jgi:hypothetical protein
MVKIRGAADYLMNERNVVFVKWQSSKSNTFHLIQCIRKVFRPLDYFHILLRYSLILKLIKLLLPHNDKAKIGF